MKPYGSLRGVLTMADPEQDDSSHSQDGAGIAGSERCTDPPGMTLEDIIDMTGEMEHLNELVMLHLEIGGGYAGTDAYFAAVRPILDMLESEIRINCHPGMEPGVMKGIIATWIDREIVLLQ